MTASEDNPEMCYYIQTHVNCGHREKLSVDPSQCSCVPDEKKKITETVDATKDAPEKSEKGQHGKHGICKGEVRPVRESWCSKCLIIEKAGVVDDLTAGKFGRLLSKAINPGEAQIHPIKIHTRAPESSEGKAEKKEGVTVNEDEYMIPKWGTQWQDKTRTEMKREIRDGKLEMVDQIRVLRGIVKASDMTTKQLEEKIQAQTDERKAAEQKKKDDAESERREKMAKIDDEINEKREQKAKEKADRYRDHLQRMAQKKARVLYRV